MCSSGWQGTRSYSVSYYQSVCPPCYLAHDSLPPPAVSQGWRLESRQLLLYELRERERERERERACNRQQTALGCHCPVFGADNPAQTKNNTGKLMDQCELCVAGSSLYMGWVRSHRESSMSHSESSAPVLYTVTAIDENNFMLSATSLLIGRPGVIVLHFL